MEAEYDKDHSQPTDVDEVNPLIPYRIVKRLTYLPSGVVCWLSLRYVKPIFAFTNIVILRLADIGGGSVSNDTTINLARIPLRWMIRECFKTKTGIMFDRDGLRGLGLDPDALYPDVLPRPPPLPVGNARIQDIPTEGSVSQVQKDSALKNFSGGTPEVSGALIQTEEELELKDALSPIYDQLSLAWFWWILEIFPIKQRFQRGDNTWSSYLGWNLGRGRIVPKQKKQGVRVHRSVKMRLESQHTDGSKYKPKANIDFQYATWVD